LEDPSEDQLRSSRSWRIASANPPYSVRYRSNRLIPAYWTTNAPPTDSKMLGNVPSMTTIRAELSLN